MGDTTDGSSSAAQSAQLGNTEKRGFWGRIFGNTQTSIKTGDAPAALHDYGRLRLNAQRVEDVAIPRADIIGLALENDLPEAVELFKSSGFSRLPVYDETLDDALGMVHLKDVALTYGFNGKRKTIDLQSLVRPVLFVPPSMPLGVLLQKMQAERTHMALVVDEYGGVDGLVTIEDLVEQLVGDIADEHDNEEEAEWRKTPKGDYIAQARADLRDFSAELGVDFALDDEDEEIDTIGGLIFKLSGRVPARGEIIAHESGYQFEILDADPRRIKRVKIRKSSG